MLARLRIGERTFAPSWGLTLLAAASVVAFLALGRWQWDRGSDRSRQWAAFDTAERALPADSRDLAALPRFQRVALTGRYDADRQFILDNRSHEGRAGFEVLTPLALGDGRVVLVNRGWIAFSGYRDRMPDVGFAGGAATTVTGRLDTLPVAGLPRGRAAPTAGDAWPKLTSFPTLAELAAAYGRELEPRIVLLDADAPHGYRRDWRPAGIAPERHFAYAVQWWGFAVLAAMSWIVLSFTRQRE